MKTNCSKVTWKYKTGLLLALTFFVSGCVPQSVKIASQVRSDGSFVREMEMVDMAPIADFQLPKGFVWKDTGTVDQEHKYHRTAIGEFKNIKDFSWNYSEITLIKKNYFIINTYKYSEKFKPENVWSKAKSLALSGVSLESSIKLPGIVTGSNTAAMKKEGNSVAWSLKFKDVSKGYEITLSSIEPNFIGIIILGAAIIAAIFILKKMSHHPPPEINLESDITLDK